MAAKKKAATKKKKTRIVRNPAVKRKAPKKKGPGRKAPKNPPRGKPKQLDRELYARARAEGKNKSESARLAGSKANTVESLCSIAKKMEAEPGMAELMAVAREHHIRSLDDTWEKAQARMSQMLDHPKWQARAKGADFAAKVVGGYAAQKVEHSGSVETTPVAEFAKLSAEDRAAIREILNKRAEG